MEQFCLGIIGRCLACQPWMQLSDLYHRQLKIILKERDGITLRVSLSGRSDLEPYERMRILHTKKPLNGVLYHMREAPEQPLLYSRRNPTGKRRYSFHPCFFKHFRAAQHPIYEGGDAVRFALSKRKNKDAHKLFESPLVKSKFLSISLRQVNLLAGKLCGLNTDAIVNEWIFFERLREYCLELKIPLFVLGPIPSAEILEAKNKSLLWERMRNFAVTELSRYEIPYYFLHTLQDEIGRPIHKGDRVHLNPEGHALLARELYPVISPWIRSILRATYTQPTSYFVL